MMIEVLHGPTIVSFGIVPVAGHVAVDLRALCTATIDHSGKVRAEHIDIIVVS